MANEKLIIKNFGPIKSVELDLNRFNVLIGQQGTGKSTIAKLYSILNNFGLIQEPKFELFTSLLKNYNINYYSKNTYISYSKKAFEIEINNEKISVSNINNVVDKLLNATTELEIAAKNLLSSIKTFPSDTQQSAGKMSIYQLEREALYILSNIKNNKVYIPAERVIISMVFHSPFSFINNQVNLPKYIIDFGQYYEYAKGAFENISFDFLKIKFTSDNENGDLISFLETDLTIKLSESASGYQSIIPLLIGLHQQKDGRISQQLVIEEPEQNLFPSTQYDLIKYIVNITQSNNDTFITTHSPYTLTSLNNLMYAYLVGQKHPDDVIKEIDKKYWLNPNDVSAYMLKSDGSYEDIFDREEGLIKAEKIDEVSKEINRTFNKLLDIEFKENEPNS